METEEKKWVCRICGHTARGDSPPSVCPECGAPKDFYEEIKPLTP